MNIVLLESSEIVENCVIVEDERAKHIVKILRSTVGESIRIGIINGLMGSGIIEKITGRPPYTVQLRISLGETAPPPSNIDIVLALPRPIMFKRVLSQATTLGVKEFHITNASRVEKSFWDAHVLDESVYRTHLLKGLEQAGDTIVPELHFHKAFNSFIEADLSRIKEAYKYMVVADPRFSYSPHDLLSEGPGRILLAVGPEGGWLDHEIDKMVRAGFRGFGIGRRILRVDTAVISLHSLLSV